MTKYHFNPESGAPGPCSAEISCPFGIPLDGHYGSMREAALAAEQQIASEEGGSFSKVQSFESWSQKEERQGKSPGVSPTRVDQEQYENLMPYNHKNLGVLAHRHNLSLMETWEAAGVLNNLTYVTPSSYPAILKEGLKLHVAEAESKNRTLDEQLKGSPFFENTVAKGRGEKVYVESVFVYGSEEYITRVGADGKVAFEVYDQETGESERSYDTKGFQGSVPSWMEHFKAYQDHLYLRAAWAREESNRRSRQSSIAATLA